MVPESSVAAAKPTAPAVKVQSNGLPEGVEILPLDGTKISSTQAVENKDNSMSDLAPAAAPVISSLIHGRARFGATGDKAPAVAKRRKPGRPKAGKLDIPQRSFSSPAPEKLAPEPAPKILSRSAPLMPLAADMGPAAAPAVPAAKLPHSPLPKTSAPAGPRRLNDLAPRRPVAPAAAPAAALVNESKPAKAHHDTVRKPSRPKRHAHHVGVPALHYGPVLAFSLRARARPRLVALAALGALSLGVASAYGVAQLLSGGLTHLADGLVHAGPNLIGETIVLALVYYIGRSIGQTALIYGISREADQRPVTLSRQFGIAINTFARRLRLDIGFGIGELLILGACVTLFITGGSDWPLNIDVQVGLIFLAYLVLLYLLVALALARGLAGVNLTLTSSRPSAAARLGWQLFSHRIELIGPRLSALLMEAVLSVPLLALVVALVITVPAAWHPAAILGAGLLAWLAGSLVGVGTAAWWAMLYRQLVTADRPEAGTALLSGRQPEDARRLPLSIIIAGTSFVVAAGLILPWLSL